MGCGVTLSARVCCITGAATGIGAACARAFAAQGWNVALSAFGDEQTPLAVALAQECTAHGVQASTHALDVRDDASCAAFAQAALARHGRIDALVHCAATTRFVPHDDFDTLDAAELHRTYDVNTVGAWRMVRALRPALHASGQGSVVLVSSIGGLLGRGSSVAYAASKGALNTLTLALARAMAQRCA